MFMEMTVLNNRDKEVVRILKGKLRGWTAIFSPAPFKRVHFSNSCPLQQIILVPVVFAMILNDLDCCIFCSPTELPLGCDFYLGLFNM